MKKTDRELLLILVFRARVLPNMLVVGWLGSVFFWTSLRPEPTLSAFGYNETIANDEWTLAKEEALVQGFNWSEETVGRYDPPTREWIAIPDGIENIDESICKEVLARMYVRNPRKFWHRQCTCELTGHDHSGRCTTEFETTYAPDRPEKVYCQSCYQKEVV